LAILERNAAAHLGVRRHGAVEPLCLSWRSTWNWTLVPSQVTCPQCRMALEGSEPEAEKERLPPEG
jgi:hypothetical protein